MNYDRLIPGSLLRRYKRFLADVELEDGSVATAHCPNSGSMQGCFGEGWPVRLSRSENPRRKYRLAAAVISDGTVIELAGYESLRREVAAGEHSRIDFLLENPGRRCWVEVKNVTMVDDCGRYAFPDAVTSRGLKHLWQLAALAAAGDRAVMLFVIQRSDGDRFSPARDIDPAYADGLDEVSRSGVEVLAYTAQISPESNTLSEPVPVEI